MIFVLGDKRSGRSSRERTRARVLLAGLWVVVLCVLALFGPAEARAQESHEHRSERDAAAPFFASAYLPLGHWAYDVLSGWVASGRIT
ncbi:MAG: hypothetical protein V3U67_05640, partial [Gemmatimonadota bacterium]